MRVCVVGLGYVGIVTAVGMAEWGHDVTGIEVNRARLDSLKSGVVPLHEPGLDELFERHAATDTLRFTDVPTAVESAHLVVVAVGTHDGNGGWQTETVRACLASIAPAMADDAVLVIRSTLPPEFLTELGPIVADHRRAAGRPPVPILTNPEFTREGSAVGDFLHPDRVVIGVLEDPAGAGVRVLRQVYRATQAPTLVMDARDAILTKLGANLFLATKISFANELAALCEAFGGDVVNVVTGMSYDPRIGGSFLRAGVGFGGSCLPHQVSMTIRAADEAGVAMPLMRAVDGINHAQRRVFVDRLVAALDRPVAEARIALLGLTFKPGTDDLRDAPSLTIAASLLAAGATVVAYDPMPRARTGVQTILPAVEIAESAHDAIRDADAIALVTEWPEFGSFDWAEIAAAMRGRVVFDGRNVLDGIAIEDAGLSYHAFGRRLDALPVDDGVGLGLSGQPGLAAPIESAAR